ncbi:hypothetical protein CKO_01955 [Citrobacter koseri ATCC BAA-895]|uniref:Uncharacterized protein n=1 Tax=Citrobacter koseri (strain ATCC BAA-895 / CDC 4225-83 / SGSC4696) TaxID=290338 RepID=A8AHW9_CITK8|nr:hypothetical protein CKO_01955 [Citrobacter koseri ATCC BAA-895]
MAANALSGLQLCYNRRPDKPRAIRQHSVKKAAIWLP